MTGTELDPAPSATPARRTLARSAAFVTVGAVLALFFFAAAAPSALYQAQWRFSPVTWTAVLAVYALALLAALLTTGSLSDVIGRRPVLLAAVGTQVIGMVLTSPVVHSRVGRA